MLFAVFTNTNKTELNRRMSTCNNKYLDLAYKDFYSSRQFSGHRRLLRGIWPAYAVGPGGWFLDHPPAGPLPGGRNPALPAPLTACQTR